MHRLPRRQVARIALIGASAFLGRRPPPAAAAALVDPGATAGRVVRYVQRLVTDPAADNINAHLEPTTASDVVATIPFATPLTVLDQTSGEPLSFGDGSWSEVQLPYGTGWVYAALLDASPPGSPAPPLPPPVPAPPTAPSPVGPGRSIIVSRDDQFLWAYAGGALVLAVGCTTGNPRLATPLGAFAVSGHFHPYAFLSPWPVGSPDWYPPSLASYALRFLGRDFYLHDAPWRHVFGPASQGGSGPPGGDQTGSHGCVNLPYPAARFLYDWASEGTPVQVIGAGNSTASADPAPLPVATTSPVGGVPHSAAASTAPPPGGRRPNPPNPSRRYTVRPGDTLSSLAVRLGVSVAALVQANGLHSANQLRAGQTLRVP